MKYYLATILLKGVKESHLIKAKDRASAINRIKKEYKGTLLKIEETSAPIEDKIKKFIETFKSFFGNRKVEIKHLIAVIRQLAVMTSAGISIHDAINEIAKSTTDKQLKKILIEAFEDINAGLSLSNTFNRYRSSVGGLTIAMIELGEQTGNISSALANLADMLEEIEDNIAKFKKAMRYPMITLGAMAIAFTILIMMVVPKFKSIFDKFHTELPLPTRILLNIENILNNYGLLVLSGITLIITLTIYSYRKNYNFKYNVDALLLKIYLIKDIIFFSTLSRFTIVFTELLYSGIPIASALNSATNMIDNSILKEKLETVKISVSRGISLTDSFKDTGLFENMIIQMINAGESSGQLDIMMRKVTDYYRMKFNFILDNLSSYIEPIMLTIIALLVLLLAMGIFLPMWDMAGAVNGH